MSVPLKLFVDTNVWLDYYLGRDDLRAGARTVINASKDGAAVLYVTDSVLKDFFYLFCRTLKIQRQKADGAMDDATALAINQTAWACLNSMRKLALVVPVGMNEVLDAFSLRTAHGDFEDDLVMAAARKVDADYLVTSDKRLMRHSVIPCLDCRAEKLGL